GPSARWSFLTSAPMRSVPPAQSLNTAEQVNAAAWSVGQLREKHAFVAVLRSGERLLPRIEGGKFHGGEFTASLSIFSLEDFEFLCTNGVSAHSSEEVAGLRRQSREDALWNDFLVQVRRAIEATVDQMAPGLGVDFG